MTKPQAILLLGPTGSGKTPLGEMLEARGLAGRRCHHFDFGGWLRSLVEQDLPPEFLSAGEVWFIRGVLQSGALLKDGQFPLAEKVLRRFLAERGVQPGDWIVLNGLPRHVGQVRDLDALVDVRAIVEIRCEADTVARRIRSDVGGDRDGRTDDDPAAVRARLETYARRTAPLADHYRARGAPIVPVEVGAETSAEDMWNLLNARFRTAPHGHCPA